MRRIVLLFLLLAGAVTISPAQAQTVDKAEIVGRRLHDVVTRQTVGSVRVRLHGGGTQMLSSTGLASDVQVAPDRRTVGWVEGRVYQYAYIKPQERHREHPRERVYIPMRLVFWRDGRIRTRIVPKKLFTVNWRFQGNGDRIAVASAGSHGQTYYQLFETRRGRSLAYARSTDQRRPDWANGLGTR